MQVTNQRIQITGLILLIVIIIIFLSKLSSKNNRNRYSRQIIREVKNSISQADFANGEAEQATKPAYKFMHVVRSLEKLYLARNLMPPHDLMKLLHLDVDMVIEKLERERKLLIEGLSAMDVKEVPVKLIAGTKNHSLQNREAKQNNIYSNTIQNESNMMSPNYNQVTNRFDHFYQQPFESGF